MDFLAEIKSPDASHLTKFVAGPRWDCRQFMHFAGRHGWLSKVPVHLRGPNLDLHIPYTELMYPSPQEENEGLFLSWFYFGLAAELYGLNEGPYRRHDLEQDEAEREFAAFQQELVVERDGSLLLDGIKMMEKLEPRLQALMAAEGITRSQICHLHECLDFTHRMVDSIPGDLDEWMVISIAGLGETISSALRICRSQPRVKAMASEPDTPPLPSSTAFLWTHKAARSQRLREDMLRGGWCPSEIDHALTMHLGLASICSLSQLDRKAVRRDHSFCTSVSCKAFQIDLEKYELTHAVLGCSCDEYAIDIYEVERILLEASTYPILYFTKTGDGTVNVTVEEYQEGVEYVALSHVWADGLGNPHANSIQQCQIERLHDLVLDLQKTMGSPNEDKEYRFWIDTLCCPVALDTKWVALQKIPDVYSNATHVLVLDSSLYTYSKSSPQEAMLRIFGTSSWLRRLWTLQEGALAKSLCFQFSDGAVHDYDVVGQLQQVTKFDARLNVILDDIGRYLLRVHTFWGEKDDEAYSTATGHFIERRLHEMQWALYFRAVTVSADEALCLATLLSLDIGRIARARNREDRMALVWTEIAQRYGGVPSRIIFAEDHPLKKPGFRWAPSSLLGSSFKSIYDVKTKANRFITASQASPPLGIPTPNGLRVVFPGYKIEVRPLAPGLPLHPWQGVVKIREDMLYVRLESLNQWSRIMDSEHLWSKLDESGSPEDEERWFRKTGNRLCEAMHNGNAAMINDVQTYDASINDSAAFRQSLLVHTAAQDQRDSDCLQARLFRPLVTFRLSTADLVVVEGLKHLALSLATSDATRRCADATNRSETSEEWLSLRTEVREEMKQAAQEYWDANPAFAEAVKERVGPDMRDWVWIMIPKLFSHEIILHGLPEAQAWVVD